ncbi:tRNA (adenosine(37)-N6)-dimethylallyltransferase MiaA [Dehalogenimonas etheniformans]|uniref:tRNA dimethylallyltransferase n=1 Tax=Dehalogenimonas etheniformans TaxID=1536648 RepID=A0A2P5P9J2_9CHLR|nr:tRNA (adenosine(37)-N6)-dimethylallyltransferase MiaA [Dehalogenimonas etheniformans]PPD58950.1 tRNA (adenosine(37)-N6)-dimethylallyltransferase MiaA [Dehalogenimonas etheniformans]QNT76281.1 tRNA (adenosine(37)-N6)-dimethylallyltransferase MiaA [Dehalogenimonas etheniformans]
MNKLVAIVGPTGVGKSDLSIKLARLFNGEIVNADSRQLLKYLDIGTAKLSLEEQQGIPVHLVDITSPDKDFNLAEFQQLTYSTINEVQTRDRLPFLVGGSGLYVWTVLEGWQIPKVEPNKVLREMLENEAQTRGAEVLYGKLKELDPAAAAKINTNNVRRVIRALEIRMGNATDDSARAIKQPLPYRILVIGLTTDRKELYRRIDARVDKMLEKGLVEEVRSVLQMGYGADSAGLKSVGYKEVLGYLRGEMDLRETSERIKAETHRLVRHQYNWFNLKDNRIHWFDIGTEYFENVKQLITDFGKEADSEYGFY